MSEYVANNERFAVWVQERPPAVTWPIQPLVSKPDPCTPLRFVATFIGGFRNGAAVRLPGNHLLIVAAK